jgi:hypothetical protein
MRCVQLAAAVWANSHMPVHRYTNSCRECIHVRFFADVALAGNGAHLSTGCMYSCPVASLCSSTVYDGGVGGKNASLLAMPSTMRPHGPGPRMPGRQPRWPGIWLPAAVAAPCCPLTNSTGLLLLFTGLLLLLMAHKLRPKGCGMQLKSLRLLLSSRGR